MALTKIQIIKMLRDQVPGLGLKDAKDIVDSYEVKSFEDRVVRALGEDARQELYTWARLYASKRGLLSPGEFVAENNFRYENHPAISSPYGCDDECCRPVS